MIGHGNQFGLLGAVGGNVGAPLFLLDNIVTAPTAAYSLRRLRSAYTTNKCINVRRSSDNATQDIGFVNGGLDTATLLTFCGAGNGFINTWYDQSGGGRDLSQPGANNQAQIVATGAIINTLNALACMKFNQGANVQKFALGASGNIASILSPSAYTIFSVARSDTGNASTVNAAGLTGIYGDNSQADVAAGFSSTVNEFAAGHNDGADKYATVAGTFPFSGQFVHTYDGATISAWVDGGTPGTIAAGNVVTLVGTNSIWSVASCGAGSFANSLGGNNNNGYLQELIAFNVHLSQADRNTIGSKIASFYGRAWTNT